MSFTFEDHSDDVLREAKESVNDALEEIGQIAERYAIMKTPTDTGNLKNNITHTVQNGAVFIGTNVDYGVYVELGTGAYASEGNGRQGWWVYVAGQPRASVGQARRIYTEQEARQIVAILRSQGLDAHMTNGMKPSHMIRDSITDHKQRYKDIIKDNLKR
jgi:phage gpG-like protein